MKKTRYLNTFVCGFALSFSFPPYNYFFLAWFLPAIPLYYLFCDPSLKNSARAGFLWAGGFFLGLIYWVAVPTPWGILLVLFLMCYFAAVFAVMGLWVRMCRKKIAGPSVSEWLGAALLWLLAEYIRNYFLTGFPWGQLGYSQYICTEMIQFVSYTGVYGLTFLVVAGNCIIAKVEHEHLKNNNNPRSLCVGIILFTCVCLYLSLWGMHKVNQAESGHGDVKKIGIVQGNIPLEDKWNPLKKEEIIKTYLELSRQLVRLDAQIIVWPESALPFYYNSDDPERYKIEGFVQGAGISLIAGGLDRTRESGRDVYRNSAFAIHENGTASRYDKTHLVPFGEYTPLLIKKIFPFISKLTLPGEDFSPGLAAKSITISKNLDAGMLVCYEDVFPEISRSLVKDGAQFLVTISNDAWFGKSTGVYQHLGMAVFRAVENGVYLVRAANTGISAFVSSQGEILNMTCGMPARFHMNLSSKLFSREILLGDIHLNKGGTFYSKFGDQFVLLCFILLTGLGCRMLRRSVHPR